jgi:hypothetical protein
MTPEPIRGLDRPCPHCARPTGDHTLREWSECIGAPSEHLPYEDTPAATRAMADELRDRFGIDDDVLVADHIVAKAIVLDGQAGVLSVQLPGVLHEFAIGQVGAAPLTTVKVLFIGPPDVVRSYGRLVRDTANGAVNAAARAA